MSADLDLSVVIPAWNEALRLPATLEAVTATLATFDGAWELIVVDDGSTDHTVGLCRAWAARIPSMRVIASAPNRGKGYAVRLGMRAARGWIRVMCDADGSMPARELPRLIAPVREGAAEVVIGSRHVPGARVSGQPVWRRVWSRTCNLLVRRRLVPGVRDIHSGYKALTADAAEALFCRATLDGWAFDLEILAWARKLGFEVLEVGIEWRDDRRSRVDPVRDLAKTLREVFALRPIEWRTADLRPGRIRPGPRMR